MYGLNPPNPSLLPTTIYLAVHRLPAIDSLPRCSIATEPTHEVMDE